MARLSNPTTSTTGSATNVALTYFSYLGGSGADTGTAITVDNGSGAVVTGSTLSSDFPVVPPRTPFNLLLVVCKTRLLRAFTPRPRPAKPRVPGPVTSVAAARMQVAESRWTSIRDPMWQGRLPRQTCTLPSLSILRKVEATLGGYDAFVTQLGSAMSLSVQGSSDPGYQISRTSSVQGIKPHLPTSSKTAAQTWRITSL